MIANLFHKSTDNCRLFMSLYKAKKTEKDCNFNGLCYNMIALAGVAELADALDLGSSAFGVQVRFLSPAP